MKKLALALCLSSSVSSFAFASALQLRSVQSNGSGCPVSANTSIPYGFDGEWLSFDLQRNTDMQVARGTGISLEESRRQCAFTLDMKAASGYRFALERIVVWGNAQIGGGDQVLLGTDAFFAGSGATVSVDDSLSSGTGRNEPYVFDRWVSPPDQVWSDCRTDRALTINTALRIASQNQMRHVTYSTADQTKIAVKFTVQKCR